MLNERSEALARALLGRCCGASRWVEGMLARRPFGSHAALLEAADSLWAALGEQDYLEAFSHHPRIGEQLDVLRARFPETSHWAGGEQAGVRAASEATLLALRDENRAYYERFGFIFIVCASAKGADELLSLLRERLANPRPLELAIAAGEQAKITRLRLEKLAP